MLTPFRRCFLCHRNQCYLWNALSTEYVRMASTKRQCFRALAAVRWYCCLSTVDCLGERLLPPIIAGCAAPSRRINISLDLSKLLHGLWKFKWFKKRVRQFGRCVPVMSRRTAQTTQCLPDKKFHLHEAPLECQYANGRKSESEIMSHRNYADHCVMKCIAALICEQRANVCPLSRLKGRAQNTRKKRMLMALPNSQLIHDSLLFEWKKTKKVCARLQRMVKEGEGGRKSDDEWRKRTSITSREGENKIEIEREKERKERASDKKREGEGWRVRMRHNAHDDRVTIGVRISQMESEQETPRLGQKIWVIECNHLEMANSLSVLNFGPQLIAYRNRRHSVGILIAQSTKENTDRWVRFSLIGGWKPACTARNRFAWLGPKARTGHWPFRIRHECDFLSNELLSPNPFQVGIYIHISQAELMLS